MADLSRQIKRLETVPLRHAFPDEARHLTPWLAKNLDALCERLDLQFSLVQQEKAVGDFRLDLFCQDADGQKIIIENQVEPTDHDHLGKLLTYLVNLDAKIAIWITSDPRPEHQKVVEWLNEASPNDTSFYLVKVEAIKTGDDIISPLFTVLAKPDEQSKKIGQEKKDNSQQFSDLWIKFWILLLSNKSIKQTEFADNNPKARNHLSSPSGVPNSWFSFSVNNNDSYVYLTFKFEDDVKTERVFDALTKQKKEIESTFGEPLIWSPQTGSLWPWIGKKFAKQGLQTPEAWPKLQDEMIDAMIRLNKVLRHRLHEAVSSSRVEV